MTTTKITYVATTRIEHGEPDGSKRFFDAGDTVDLDEKATAQLVDIGAVKKAAA